MTEIMTRKVVTNEEDLNRDPLTGAPGAHPLARAPARHPAELPEPLSEWQWAGRWAA